MFRVESVLFIAIVVLLLFPKESMLFGVVKKAKKRRLFASNSCSIAPRGKRPENAGHADDFDYNQSLDDFLPNESRPQQNDDFELNENHLEQSTHESPSIEVPMGERQHQYPIMPNICGECAPRSFCGDCAPRSAYPLPECYTNDSGFMCCNPNLEYLMKETFLDLRKTRCGTWNSNNIQQLTNAIENKLGRSFKNNTFEVITGHSDFVAQIQFAGNMVCKIQQEGKVILAFATPQEHKVIETTTHRHVLVSTINYEKELQEVLNHPRFSRVYRL